MNWNWKEYNREKALFKSYYCLDCKQTKPCHILNKEYCCSCFYKNEQEKAQEFSNYEQILKDKKREQKARFQQLNLLKSYAGCKDCGSKEIDAYSLYENGKLTCWSCLVKKEGGASSPISFTEQNKWFKKNWGINLKEYLEKDKQSFVGDQSFSQLPINKNCADKWLKNNQHLNNCTCLEQETKELCLLFTNSLQESREKLVNCSCKKSKKIRVSSDYATNCQGCEREISVASKKRVIKNRNDPNFWGLAVKEKVLCGDCLEQRKGNMSPLRRAKFKEYRKLGRI